jgi:hypothetical protein
MFLDFAICVADETRVERSLVPASPGGRLALEICTLSVAWNLRWKLSENQRSAATCQFFSRKSASKIPRPLFGFEVTVFARESSDAV